MLFFYVDVSRYYYCFRVVHRAAPPSLPLSLSLGNSLSQGQTRSPFVQGPERSVSFQHEKLVEDTPQALTEVFLWVGIGYYIRLKKNHIVTNVFYAIIYHNVVYRKQLSNQINNIILLNDKNKCSLILSEIFKNTQS